MEIHIKKLNITETIELFNLLKSLKINVTLHYTKESISDNNRDQRIKYYKMFLDKYWLSDKKEISIMKLAKMVKGKFNISYKTFQRDIDFMYAQNLIDKYISGGKGAIGRKTIIRPVGGKK